MYRGKGEHSIRTRTMKLHPKAELEGAIVSFAPPLPKISSNNINYIPSVIQIIHVGSKAPPLHPVKQVASHRLIIIATYVSESH